MPPAASGFPPNSQGYQAMDDVNVDRGSARGQWSPDLGGATVGDSYRPQERIMEIPDAKAKRASTLYSVTGYIIINEFCERLAYYGFAGEKLPLDLRFFFIFDALSTGASSTPDSIWSCPS